MLKNLFKKKTSTVRIRKAAEHEEFLRGQTEAKARAQKLMKSMEAKKHADNAPNKST